jgi:hypothetical protein
MLSAEQLTQYEADGYLHLRGVVPPHALDLAQTILKRWEEETVQRWVDDGLLDDPMDDLDFEHRLVEAWEKAGRPGYVRSPRRDLVSRETFDFLCHPAFVDVAEALLGTPEISVHGVFNARPKLPDQAWTLTPWHQDAQYYRDAATSHVVSMWMPLQKVTEYNSCMQVSPGFHKGAVHEAWDDGESGFIGLSPEIQETLTPVSIEMDPGDVLCFTQGTPHRALPNQSDAVRWSMDVRFEATERATKHGKARGFIARSPSDPSRIMPYEKWIELWADQPAGTY